MNSNPLRCGSVFPKLCLGEMSVPLFRLLQDQFFFFGYWSEFQMVFLGGLNVFGVFGVLGVVGVSDVRMDSGVAFISSLVLKGLSSFVVVEDSIDVH
jgi:hypothetical protein